jgi:hypothetical protein
MRFIVILLFSLSTLSSVGQAFPELIGELLNSSPIILPENCKGKYTLIGLAYSQKAEPELRSWYDPAIDKFILKRGMFDSEYDVNTYFVPMFHGVTKVSYDKAFKKTKELTDERLYEHIVFFKGDLKPYKESLQFKYKEKPLFFLLDKDGNIVKRYQGEFREKYFDEIIAYIDSH